MPTSVLFDLDGTLTDPFEGITRCIRHAMEKMGRPLSPDADLRWAIGPPLLGSLATLLDDDGSAEKCLAHYRERFSEVGMFENRVYDGVPEMLGNLSGSKLFLATSKPTVYAERILEKFGLAPHFAGVYGSELDGRRTDKGDLIGHLVTAESIRADYAVMVGDRSHDVLGARSQGLASIGVLYGYGTEEELRLAQPDAIISSPGEVAAAATGLLSPGSLLG